MKQINLFEMFAGIGSQYKALKNIASETHVSVHSLGCCDFYINAIIAYMKIHYNLNYYENELTVEQMVKTLNKYSWSSDSKKVVNKNYFQKMSEKKIRTLFPYLYAYINNDYFNKIINRDERERERVKLILLFLMLFQKTLIFLLIHFHAKIFHNKVYKKVWITQKAAYYMK